MYHMWGLVYGKGRGERAEQPTFSFFAARIYMGSRVVSSSGYCGGHANDLSGRRENRGKHSKLTLIMLNN